MTKFADQKENEWERSNANKDQLPDPVTSKELPQIQEHIKLLNAAALAIEPSYPLIAKALKRMARDLNKTIELL